MNRCNSCSKLCGLEQEEPEAQDPSVERAGHGKVKVSGDVEMMLNSACCGDIVKTANESYEVDADVDHEFDTDECDPLVEVDETESEERFEGKGRGMRHFYGAVVRGHIDCECGAENIGTFEAKVECQSSAFEQA